MTTAPEGLERALAAPDASARLQAALAAGTHPDPARVGLLVARCAVEPDFFVRDMLTWALTRHPADLTVPLLLAEVTGRGHGRRRPGAQPGAAHAVQGRRPARLGGGDARAAARPRRRGGARRLARRGRCSCRPDRRGWLAEQLAGQLGRGDRDVRLSLSRALVDLGPAAAPALAEAAEHGDDEVRAHAIATQRLVRDPRRGVRRRALGGAARRGAGGCPARGRRHAPLSRRGRPRYAAR